MAMGEYLTSWDLSWPGSVRAAIHTDLLSADLTSRSKMDDQGHAR